MSLEIYQKLSDVTGYTSENIAVIANSVAKGTNPTELAYFLNVAKSTGLNPFTKQIWCYKDNKNNLIIMAGRDGFLSIAQKDKRWNGMTSTEFYSNDHFEVDVINGIIDHKPNFKDRGQLIGAYAFIKPKGIEQATFEYANLKDYDKGQFIWNSHKNEMIKKVAEIHALKKAFGIGGLYCEEEYIPIKDNPDKLDKFQMLDAIEECNTLEDVARFLAKNTHASLDSEVMKSVAAKKNKITQ